MAKRDAYFDFIKGILILLVLLGHAIQYGSGMQYLEEGIYWENIIMKGIYSFHMPLFILISGYFLYFSFSKHGIVKTSISRWKKLLLPITTWVPIVILFSVVFDNGAVSIKGVIRTFLSNFWFLWAVLFCSTLLAIGESLSRKWKIAFYIIIQILFLIVPDILWAHAYKFVFPFFLTGYYFAKKDMLKKLVNKRVTIISTVVWLVLLCFYSKESYIYTTGYTLFKKADGFIWYRQLGINIYRMLVGLTGCIAWLSTLKLVWNKSEKRGGISQICTVWIGKHSIAIYILSTYSFTYLLPAICKNMKPNLVLWLVETSAMAIVCSGFTYLINKCKILSKCLIGE
ncbi:MAG: acyltransferase family protein [Lachnospiraceae bacterium]|nr:acyltransferase family protein [Lachnospiraceae bacterium]